MADCSKNKDYPVFSGAGLTHNIQYSTDRKELRLIELATSSIECKRNIDSNVFLGVKIVNDNIVYSDAISGLGNSMTMSVLNNPEIKIDDVGGGVLKFIGSDDINNGFTVNQLNIRYDAATNSVKLQF